MLDPISIIGGLMAIAPTIGRWIDGEDGEKVAKQIVGTAQAITGQQEPADAVGMILSDPPARQQFIAAWKDIELGLYEAETRRLETVNQTIRAEIASGDPFVRRARSSFLWAMSFGWTVEGTTVAGCMLWLVMARPEGAPEMIAGLKDLMASMAEHWMYAMAVSGVAVWARTTDKQTAANSPGLLGRIGGMIKRGGA